MGSSALAPLHAHDFPTGGHPRERLRFLVRYAVLAPSGHNTQPRLFGVDDGGLDLLADRTRALPVVDPHDRELTIGCGAALDHLTVAAAAFGHPADVATLPDPGSPDLLATVRLDVGHRAPTREDVALFDAIPVRRTNRHRFDRRSIPAQTTGRLVALAAEEGAWLAPLHDDSARHAAVDLVTRGDQIQFGDPSFRRELAAWLHPRRTGDGLAEGSPLLAVLGTETDDDAAWIAAGRALSRVLLAATAAGISASFLNQPIEVAELRPRLAEIPGRDGHPQLLRFGHGPRVAAAPRRPLADVLI